MFNQLVNRPVLYGVSEDLIHKGIMTFRETVALNSFLKTGVSEDLIHKGIMTC